MVGTASCSHICVHRNENPGSTVGAGRFNIWTKLRRKPRTHQVCRSPSLRQTPRVEKARERGSERGGEKGQMWLGCAALRLSLLLQGLGVVFGSLNATWLAPTPGCSPSLPAYASCVLADVCAPSYFVYDMGDIIRWSMVATNPTKVTQSYERVVHCTGPDVLVRTKCHPVVIRVGLPLPFPSLPDLSCLPLSVLTVPENSNALQSLGRTSG